MTDTNNEPTAASKAPAFIAYHVRERDGRKAIWTRIGSAWPHKDAKGFNLQVDAVPLDGSITLRVLEDKKD